MKNFLRDKHKPRNMPELKEGIRKFWRTMTPQMCCRYIDHLRRGGEISSRLMELLLDIRQLCFCNAIYLAGFILCYC